MSLPNYDSWKTTDVAGEQAAEFHEAFEAWAEREYPDLDPSDSEGVRVAMIDYEDFLESEAEDAQIAAYERRMDREMDERESDGEW